MQAITRNQTGRTPVLLNWAHTELTHGRGFSLSLDQRVASPRSVSRHVDAFHDLRDEATENDHT